MFIYTANLVEADVFTTVSRSTSMCIRPCPLLSARLLSVKFPVWISGKTLCILTEVFFFWVVLWKLSYIKGHY